MNEIKNVQAASRQQVTARYDTLVIRGATSKTIPHEAAGGEVVSWAAGHSLAEANALEEFVNSLADGCFLSLEDAQEAAIEAKETACRQREHGYD